MLYDIEETRNERDKIHVLDVFLVKAGNFSER